MEFHARPAQAYFLHPYGELPTGLPAHSLGRTDSVLENCVQCGQPLSTLLSLVTSDERLDLSKLGMARLNLCACTGGCEVEYTIAEDGGLAALRDTQAGSAPMRRELISPDFCPIALHAVPDRIVEARTLAVEGRLDEAGLWARGFDWQTPTHQIGGRPATPRNKIPAPTCPLCGKAPPFFASVVCGIVRRAGLDQPDQIQTLFFVCRECPVVIGIAADSIAP